MWLLESELFDGKKLWLRPGKLYLFGRTVAEHGQLVISNPTVSRKHLTIHVDNVPEGGARNIRSRSTVIIEDLNSKKGTLVNGVQIRGEKTTLSKDVNEVQLGTCQKLLIIRWHPVVFTFSFTSKELRADPWAQLRDQLEQLDIKYSAQFEPETTHVVSKKRNTATGLQALINGKYIVTDSFINTIVAAAATTEDAAEGTSSALEKDFEAAWPNPIDHLPPRGEEPVERPSEAYRPDPRREEVFDGYTFVFYNRKQYDSLFPVITAGKGKALLKEVVPGETDVNDFIRYVKGVAGEKGLGSFEDGSEGKGVVVVRYTPKSGEDFEWYAQFLTTFAQRLDHRPIDQREFLQVILDCDASMLRRPLQPASPSSTAPPAPTREPSSADRMDVDQPAKSTANAEQTTENPFSLAAKSARARRAGRSRFKGFDFDDVEEVAPAPEPAEEPPAPEPPKPPPAPTASQDSLFVTQARETSVPLEEEIGEVVPEPRKAPRKRVLSPIPDDDPSAFIDEIAPRASGSKRRRTEPEQPLTAAAPELEPQPVEDQEMVVDSPEDKTKRGQKKGKGKVKIKGEDDILELARRQREEAEAAAAAKRKELEELPDDGIDYAAIRRLHIIEECTVRLPQPGTSNVRARDRDQDIADGRWDPKWNGRKNFKKFRKQGEPVGRQAPRVVIPLEEVKPKEYGIGDDYWLEDEDSSSKRRKDSQPSQPQTQEQAPAAQSRPGTATSQGKGKEKETTTQSSRTAKTTSRRMVLVLDSSDEDEQPSELSSAMPDSSSIIPDTDPYSRSRAAKAAEKANLERAKSQTQTSQSQSQSQLQTSLVMSSGKRSAGTSGSAGKEPAAKKARMGFKPPSDDESDSDGELKFRWGRRR